jgi:hypothetical protein
MVSESPMNDHENPANLSSEDRRFEPPDSAVMDLISNRLTSVSGADID